MKKQRDTNALAKELKRVRESRDGFKKRASLRKAVIKKLTKKLDSGKKMVNKARRVSKTKDHKISELKTSRRAWIKKLRKSLSDNKAIKSKLKFREYEIGILVDQVQKLNDRPSPLKPYIKKIIDDKLTQIGILENNIISGTDKHYQWQLIQMLRLTNDVLDYSQPDA